MVAIDHLSDRPAYRQIADHLRSAIADGIYSGGDQLPSERQLMEQYDAARGTIRQAIAQLRSEGLIEIEHGRGAFVRRRPPVRRLGADRFARRHRRAGKAAYLVETETEGSVPSVDVLHVGPTKADAEIAMRLGIRPGEKVLVRRRRYLADGHPMELATSYLPWALAAGTPIVEENPGPGGIYARLEDLGHRLSRLHEEVSARMPTPEETQALRLAPGTPVLHLIRSATDAEGTVVEVCDTVMAADRYVLEYELPTH